MPQAGNWRFLVAAAAFACMAAPSPSIGSVPSRVASLNLCADQFLLALADRSQILSLSPLVHDRTTSFLADSVGDLPANSGRAETLLFERADLVMMGRWGSQVQRSLLERHGFQLMLLEPWRSLEQGIAEIHLAKHRNGPTGTVKLSFLRRYAKFADLAAA